MNEQDVISLFKCLADKSRLQILKSLSDEDMYVEALAQRLNLSAPTVSFHLKKLSDAGIVKSYKTQYYMMYSLCRETVDLSVLQIISEKSDEAELWQLRDAAYRQKVIDSYFEFGKIKSIPTQRKKERIILEEVAKSFDINRTYTEREVNIIIADYNDDFCTIRKDMVAEGILERSDNLYRRL